MGAQVSGRGQVVAIAASAVGYGVGTALSVVALHGLRPADEGVGRTAWQFLGATLAVLPFVLGSWWTGGSRITTAEPTNWPPRPRCCSAAWVPCSRSTSGSARSAHRAGLLYTLQPPAGALTAVALLGEPVVAGQAFGAALILACLVVLTRAEPTDHPTPTPDADAVQTTR